MMCYSSGMSEKICSCPVDAKPWTKGICEECRRVVGNRYRNEQRAKRMSSPEGLAKEKEIDRKRWEKSNSKPDTRARQEAWLEKNPRTSEFNRRHNLKRYGISPEEYTAKLIKQKGVCAICKSPDPAGKPTLSVDHCHNTKNVRGLLCARCNVGLGMFKDDITVIQSAIAYLRRTS